MRGRGLLGVRAIAEAAGAEPGEMREAVRSGAGLNRLAARVMTNRIKARSTTRAHRGKVNLSAFIASIEQITGEVPKPGTWRHRQLMTEAKQRGRLRAAKARLVRAIEEIG